MTTTIVDVRLLHPATGQPALFLSRSGRPVFPHLGADGEEDGSDDEGEDEEDSEDHSEDSEDDDGADGQDEKAKKGKKRVIDPDEYDSQVAHKNRIKKQLSESDKKRAAAERELAELKKKDLPDNDKLKADLADITKERDDLQGKFTNLARTNGFLTASAQAGISWHDLEDAMAAGRRELKDLEIDDEGGVDGILELVKDLAKRKPHLVKPAKADDDGEDEDEDKSKRNGKRNGASGSGVGSRGPKRKGKPGEPSRADLLARFPSLRR